MESHMDMLKEFLSWLNISNEEFLSQYCKLGGKAEAKQLYLLTLNELWKAASEGNVDYFKNLSNLIDCIINEESKATLSDFCNDIKNPFKGRNLLILACKHNKVEILNYILENFNILRNTSEGIICASDVDETQHNAFYYAIRSGNVGLLEILINKWPENYFKVHSSEFEDILSTAYEELKFKNVLLSNEMELFVENELINLRFFADNSENKSVKNDIQTTSRQRVHLVLENINLLLTEYYPNSKEIDERFLFIAKFVVHNIYLLKNMINSTYDTLPWEEIEFCFTCFISSYIKQEEFNLFTNVVLNKCRMFNHLEHFAKKLKEVSESSSSFKRISLSRLKRDKVIQQVVKSNPEFQELYNDYQQIRDIHSLRIIHNYINLASSVDVQSRDSQILLARVLQVMGEHLKNTVETPKLSNTTSQHLLLSLPKNTRGIIIKLRDSLSHSESLSKRMEMENNTNNNFLSGVQNDIVKVGGVIRDILYRKKIKIIKVSLNQITSCKSVEEVREVLKVFTYIKSDSIFSPNFIIAHHKKLQKLIGELCNCLTDKTNREKELFDTILDIINCEINKFERTKKDYIIGISCFASLILVSNDSKIDGNRLRGLKFFANQILTNIFSKKEDHVNQEISCLLEEIFERIRTKFRDNYELVRLMDEIFYITEIEADNIKYIEELREKINDNDYFIASGRKKKNSTPTKEISYEQLQKKLSELESILQTSLGNLKTINDISGFKNNKKLQAVVEMLVLDIMSILDRLECLENNSHWLDATTPSLIGRYLRNHLAHNNAVVDLLLPYPSVMLYLNAKKLIAENPFTCNIGKYVKDDPLYLNTRYNQKLLAVTNQQEMFLAMEESNLERLEKCIKQGADINARNVNSWTALHFASKGPCPIALLNTILEQNSDMNVENINGQSPLHIAAAHGRKYTVVFFVKEKHVEVDIVDSSGKTPLHIAAQYGHMGVVETLLKLGANALAKDTGGLSPLHHAIRNGHIDLVKILLKEDASVDVNETMGGFTALHEAAERGHVELVHFLIQNGADVNAKTDMDYTPLHAAALNGYLEIVKYLILKGAEVNSKVKQGCTPLHYAVENGHEKIVDTLLKQKANVNVFDKIYHNTPLHYTAQGGYEMIAKTLIKHKANVKAITAEMMTPLHFAAKGGHMGILIALLEHDVDTNAINVDNCIPLHYASENGYMDVVKLLIKHKSLINAKDIKGFTPLHLAAFKNRENVAEFLLINKAGINSKSKDGISPLHAAATAGSIKVIELLIKNKAPVNAADNIGQTPLHSAIINGQKESVVLLIENGAQVNARTLNMITPLHLSAVIGDIDIMNILIENEAEINAKDASLYTPLHYAVESGKKIAVEMLIENGANLNTVNKNERTPLFSAVKNNNKDIVECLISNKADTNVGRHAALSMAVCAGYLDVFKILLRSETDVNIKYDEDETILHLAASGGHTEIVKILIKKKHDVDAKTINGTTPLCLAAEKGYEEIAENLIANGASINIKNSEGCTPLHFAAHAGHSNVVNVLLNNKACTKIMDNKKRIPIELAVVNGHMEVVKMLIDYMEDISSKGNDDWTLLHISSQQNNLEMTKYLVNKMCDINVRNATCAMPIHIAAREGFKETVQFLLSKGSNVSDLGFKKQTVLHYAAMYGQFDTVKYLIDQGADVNVKDVNGLTPTHVAAASGCKDTTELLLKHGAAFNVTDVHNQKPLHLTKSRDILNLFLSIEELFEAVKLNNLLHVENCIKEGTVVNAKNGSNLTALHYAAWKGYTAVANVLLQTDCNPNSVDSKGFTPLHYAVKFSHLDIVKALLCSGAIYESFSETKRIPFDLATDENIITILRLVNETFINVKNGNSEVVNSLQKVKDDFTLKAIMNARNRENKTLVVIALDNNFPRIKELKEILQDGVAKMFDIAIALSQTDHYEEALNIFKNVAEKRKEILGPNNPGTLDVQAYIAKMTYKKGAYKEALEILEDIFQKQKQQLGFNCKDTLSTRSSYALTLHRLGRFEDALDIFQDIYPRQIELLGPNHIDTSQTHLHMALTLNKLGRYEEALSINCEVYERTKHDCNSFSLNAQNNIAMVLTNQGKYEEALKIYREVLEKKKLFLGLTHSDTLRTRQNIATTLLIQQKYAEKLLDDEEFISTQKENLGLNHPDTLTSQSNMAIALFDQGKWVGALKIFKEVLIRGEAVWGKNHPYVLHIKQRINFIYEIFKLKDMDESDIIKLLQTDINIAADEGDIHTVEYLLKNGADVNDTDGDGRTPLHFAVDKRHVDIVFILLENGADATQVTNKGNTSLHTAASKGYKDIVEILLQHVIHNKYSFINTQTTVGGNTALHVAAKIGSMDIVLVLLGNGAIYNIENKENKNPCDVSKDHNVINFFKLTEKLFEFAKKGYQEITNILKSLKHNEFLAVTNARNNQGITLLQVAILNKHKTIATELSKLLKETFSIKQDTN